MEACGCKDNEECREEGVFAPYLRGNKAEKYAWLSQVFDTSQVGRALRDVEPRHRQAFVDSLCFDAEARLRDPIMGSAGIILRLQRKLQDCKLSLEYRKEFKTLQETKRSSL